MTDHALALQVALVQVLKTAQVAEGRVYDSVPEGATYPYVSIGPADVLADDADCVESAVVTQQIDVWSEEPGFPEAKRIAAAVRAAVHRIDIPMTGATLIDIAVRQIRFRRERGGEISRGIIEVRALIEGD